MENVKICDRSESVLKPEDKSFKMTVIILNTKNNKKFEKTIDMCEDCTGYVVRNIAQRSFLNDKFEDEILKAVDCEKSKVIEKKRTVKPVKPVKSE